jgi:hypothetical protein
MQKRNAVPAIVRDYRPGIGADHLRQVELDELLSRQAAPPPPRLVGESIAGESSAQTRNLALSWSAAPDQSKRLVGQP